MQKDEEMNRNETSFLGTIKNTIRSSSETAILEFERICESLGWRRSTMVDNNSQKIKRRRNRTDIYKRVLSDNTRRSAVRDMEIQTDGVYTPPKNYNYSINSINKERFTKSQRSLKQNNNALVKGVLEELDQKTPPHSTKREQRSFYSVSPQSNAISKTMSTQTSTSPPPFKEVTSSGLLSPERSSNSISSSVDADPVSIGRKHNITPSPERVPSATFSSKRSVTRPTIASESPGSVKQLRSQIEEQLRSPYRSPTQSNVNRTNMSSPEEKPAWVDHLNHKITSQNQFIDRNIDVNRQEQKQHTTTTTTTTITTTSPIKTSSPISSPYAANNNNKSPARKFMLSPIRSPYYNESPSRSATHSPNNNNSTSPTRYIPDSPGSVRRMALQLENELRSPYLRPGMVIPKLTASPIKKAESLTKPSNVLHNAVVKHFQKVDQNGLNFEDEDERITRLEKEIKHVGTEVSMLGSYNILDSPQPSHVSNELPSIPLTPTTPTLTRTHDPSFIPEAPPFIKRPPRELVNKTESVEPLKREKPKVLKPTETHKSKMREIITQLPGIKLRRTDKIRGPDGEMISNPFWIEIYNPKIRNI